MKAIRVLLPLIILAISLRPSQALESKILEKASKYLPDLTEVGYLVNIVNLYVQMSQFVRSTNAMVRNIQEAKAQWEHTGRLVEDLYTDVQSLKNINLYDMDSWAQTLEMANHIVVHDIKDIRHSFAMYEFYTLDASLAYASSLEKAAQYDYRTQKNRETVEKYYQAQTYSSSLAQFVLVNRQYTRNTLDLLRSQLSSTTDPDRQAQLRADITLYENRLTNPDFDKAKVDSLLELSSDLITINLTEIQYAYERIKSMESMAASLREAFERLKSGQVDTRTKDFTPVTNFQFALDGYDAANADKVAAPAAPDARDIKPRKTRKKTVATQDIESLQNAIAFLSLKQEAMGRDIDIMKSNTMAFLTALEAFKQDRREQQLILAAHSAKKLEMDLEDMRK